MRYKIGNRVRVKSLSWYNENKDDDNCIDLIRYNGCGFNFIETMTAFCGKVMTISDISCDYYNMLEDSGEHYWTDEMIEGLAEEGDLIPKFGEYSDNEPLDVPTMTTEFVKEYGFPCPNGYIFKNENGNVINATKIVLEKKKKEYPKTYEECCTVLGIGIHGHYALGYESDTLSTFQNLIIYRNAYWKIAGEEMGLGKPWEPIWDYNQPDKYILINIRNSIHKDYRSLESAILAFPTEEMRDAFKENFDPDIEICKEFL